MLIYEGFDETTLTAYNNLNLIGLQYYITHIH